MKPYPQVPPGLGFTPDGGASWLVPRLVGVARAREMVSSRSEDFKEYGRAARAGRDPDFSGR